MTAENKFVYTFGNGAAEGDHSMKDLLGGKGANLAEMSAIGFPVPPGFTISTKACQYYASQDRSWPTSLEEQVKEGIDFVESAMGKRFGDTTDPLLIAVRSGAAVSMPGMMDTVLNLGLNDQTVEALAIQTENRRFAYDSYRRFIDMFGCVVSCIPHERFEEVMARVKSEHNLEEDTQLGTEHLEHVVDLFKEVYRKETGEAFPQNPEKQMKLAVDAVFDSWDSERARTYRRINNIDSLLGTAVNVQAMVFGNMGDDSATGVCFTRNPSTGENRLFGEFLTNAQGEDVVSGIRTPRDISELSSQMPKVYDELIKLGRVLERHYRNMQDIEFTIEKGRLFILQTRNGKRTGKAAIRIATEMVDDGFITEADAVGKLVEPDHLSQLLHPQIDVKSLKSDDILCTGLPASPGAAVGRVVFSTQEAEEAAEKGEPVILVRIETSPEDVGGMSAAEGILTSRGGMTSHAAVVARGWGKPCVAGCSGISIDYESGSFSNGTVEIQAGDWISVDGTRGRVIRGRKEMMEPVQDDRYKTFMQWVDTFRTMKVLANADNPEDAQKALEFGADGIGLCRTEHMFFGEERIRAMRRMIFSSGREERKAALESILPYQKEDFIKIFEVMDGLPVTIRLLDPPLHEFLPSGTSGIRQLAKEMDVSESWLRKKVRSLEEHNPMLGHRGCRLGISYPEITEVQVRAVMEAALTLIEQGKQVIPRIMIPLIGTTEEFQHQKRTIEAVANRLLESIGKELDYSIGTMIEVPRAALTAGEIAQEADFFSFGTNDLTQLTFGYSRDDAGKFLTRYLKEGILPEDPFQVLDVKGVGQLVALAAKNGRSANPTLGLGICGEHGGEPKSIAFSYHQKLDSVSCSPYRIPVARLAAAQARLREKETQEIQTGDAVTAKS